VLIAGRKIGVLCFVVFLFFCFCFSCELAIIAATHHTNTLGSSLVIGMLVRIGTIPQAFSPNSPRLTPFFDVHLLDSVSTRLAFDTVIGMSLSLATAAKVETHQAWRSNEGRTCQRNFPDFILSCGGKCW
jgi:uncharacterized membrane protein YagU involved in acid resistance